MKPEVAKTVQFFPVALRLLRSLRNLRQTELASRSGLTKAQISSFESGKVSPSIASLMAYLIGVGADLSDLQKALIKVSGGLPVLAPVIPSKQEDRERVVGRAFIRSFKVLLEELGLEGSSYFDMGDARLVKQGREVG